MRPDGIQDDNSDHEQGKVHDRSMTATETAKQVQAARPAKRAKLAAVEYGTFVKVW